ncbi:hypothetical protein Taro_010647 [Colocasia esculenta]|uniref:Uncharacterized protein n=1 Tax=Colocasia esculenta TaxID=4460 RepID=A0A843U3J3_COLES|nr:hypothetical protein [Colocasia esculenta]
MPKKRFHGLGLVLAFLFRPKILSPSLALLCKSPYRAASRSGVGRRRRGRAAIAVAVTAATVSSAPAMSAAAASARAAFLLSRFRDLSLRCHPPSSLSPGSSTALARRGTQGSPGRRLSPPPAVCCCFASGIDGGGGLADEFVFTAREERRRRREYSALANVLCRVEPLDASVIGEGVSVAAKDAMKRTISSMLGLLPSDQFHVAVGVSRHPLRRLLVSSVITGYTLWNAEYRLSLMRNFDNSPVSSEPSLDAENRIPCDVKERVDRDQSEQEMAIPERFEVLSPAALSYIQKLEAQLANTQKELDAQRQENKHMGSSKRDDSDLLEYLRSLEPAMVAELSQPSSLEVEEIIQQLVQNIHLKCFDDDATEILKDTDGGKNNFHKHFAEDNTEQSDILNTTRDYLARLLFWCVYAAGSSYERVGVQVAPKLCCWIVLDQS